MLFLIFRAAMKTSRKSQSFLAFILLILSLLIVTSDGIITGLRSKVSDHIDATKSSLNSSVLLQELLKNSTRNASVSAVLGWGRLSANDLDLAVKFLTTLVNNISEFHGNTALLSSSSQENFLEICSNLLEPANEISWKQFREESKKNLGLIQKHYMDGSKPLWNRLLVAIDRYGLLVACGMESGQNKIISTKNIIMQIDKVGPKHKSRKEGLTVKYDGNSIFLPSEVFTDNTTDYCVVNIVYKTLSNFMRLQIATNGTQAKDGSALLQSNTTMIASTVQPEPAKQLNSYVKIVLQNNEVLQPFQNATCVFWRDGPPNVWETAGCHYRLSESNENVTTCECNHLTVFAALMDPYSSPLPPGHQKALEYISTVGCAISLFAVLVTMATTAFFWKRYHRPRAVVLTNICAAIAVVCILVIAEGTARDTKVGCTVMAVLLHYFLLAVFCWMLCEGILLYLVTVKVIGSVTEEKTKFFFFLGWGFPAIMVGISLAVTQGKGYGYHGNQTACWLSVDSGLIWAFVGPAVLVLLTNLVVLVLVVRQMLSTRHVQNKSRDVKVRMVVKATAVLLSLLGITWLFGLLAFNSATLAFKYIFAILNSLQGLMIFIFHCLLNNKQNFSRTNISPADGDQNKIPRVPTT